MKAKRYFSWLLVLVIIMSQMVVKPQVAEAAWSSSYTLTGDGVKDILAVASAQIGKTTAEMGYSGKWWCDLFLKACAQKAGQSKAVPNVGFGSLRDAIKQAGGYDVSTPKAGDIVFYYKTYDTKGLAHVAIMADGTNAISGNYSGKVTKHKATTYFTAYNKNDPSQNMGVSTGHIRVVYTRPAYSNQAQAAETGFTKENYSENYLVNGQYSLVNVASGLYLNATGTAKTSNVDVRTTNGANGQKWNFTRTSSGSYSIVPASSTGMALNPYADSPTSGTNVNLYTVDKSDASQCWFVDFLGDNQFVLRLALKPSLCLAAVGTGNGSNVAVQTYNGADTQKWTVNSLSGQLPCPALNDAYYTGNSVVVTWNYIEGTEIARVFRKDPGGSWAPIADLLDKTTSYEDTNVVDGKIYIYTVRLMNADSSAYTSGFIGGVRIKCHVGNITDEATIKEACKKAAATAGIVEDEFPFEDVTMGGWQETTVRFMLENNLMKGTSETTFSPDEPMSRGQLVAVLWSLAGKPKVSSKMPFTDVPRTNTFYNAILWAYDSGVVKGTSATTFQPKEYVTRQQIAAILMNFSKYCGFELTGAIASLDGFADADQVGRTFTNAMKWAVGNKIINGKSGGTVLDPKGNATRIQVAAMVMNYINNYIK